MPLGVTEKLFAQQSSETQAIIRRLLAKIQELKSQLLKLTQQNSSLPPSSQHPHAKPIPPKSKSSRKRGGQPGHPRHQRVLIPSAECREVFPLRPSVCSCCGERLRGSDSEPRRHQVWELPEIKPVITEYQKHRLACPGCGKTTCASLPPGVPRGQSGPTFVDHEGIEPTNNTAERALRPAVIYRKLSFGSQSESSSRFLDRILTVSETCRLQNRSIYNYLVTAVQTHFKQQPIPSLLSR